jgi:hypothetical protein
MSKEYQVIVWTENDLRFLGQIVTVLAFRGTSIEHLTLERPAGGDCKYTIDVRAEEQYIEMLVRQIEKKVGILQASARACAPLRKAN